MTKFERYILGEAARAWHHYTASGMRPAWVPRLSCSASADILRTAAEMGLPDLKDTDNYLKFLDEER